MLEDAYLGGPERRWKRSEFFNAEDRIKNIFPGNGYDHFGHIYVGGDSRDKNLLISEIKEGGDVSTGKYRTSANNPARNIAD